VVHLFDKDPPTAWPASVPTPFCSENPPPSVRPTVSFDIFLLLSLINLFRLQTQGLYPKVHIDVEVSSGEDDVPKTNASADKKKALDGDDAEDGGASSAEPITPNPIRSDAPEQANSSIADRAASIVPPTSRHGRKRPATAIR
jgi:hypothetical protein